MKNTFLVILLLGTILMGIPVNAQSSCGNHSCEVGENSCTCETDCGSCSSPNPAFDYRCVDSICKEFPKTGVCGNNVCETNYKENFGSCPIDCEPTKLEIEVIEPTANTSFARNQTGTIQIKVTADGREVIGAQVTAVNPFKSIPLTQKPFTNEYTGYFTIPTETAEGTFETRINASFRGINNQFTTPFTIKAVLTPTIETNPTILLGEYIQIHGKLVNGIIAVQTPLQIRIENPTQETVHEQTVQTDSNGIFKLDFKTSLNDPEGIWTIKTTGTDDQNNTIQSTDTIQVVNATTQRNLTIVAILDGPKEIPKSKKITIIAQVFDQNQRISDAVLEVSIPPHAPVRLTPGPDGNYSIYYSLPASIPQGKTMLILTAKKAGPPPMAGQTPIEITIVSDQFSIALVKPQPRVFTIGELVEFQAYAKYDSGEPVLDANAILILNNYEIQLKPQGAGYYGATYKIQEQDTGELELKISATDKYNQKNATESKLNVFGYGAMYYVTQYGAPLIGTLIVLIAIVFTYRAYYNQNTRKTNAQKRKQQLLELEKELQEKYFEKGIVEKQEYETQIVQYEDELKKIDRLLGETKK